MTAFRGISPQKGLFTPYRRILSYNADRLIRSTASAPLFPSIRQPDCSSVLSIYRFSRSARDGFPENNSSGISPPPRAPTPREASVCSTGSGSVRCRPPVKTTDCSMTLRSSRIFPGGFPEKNPERIPDDASAKKNADSSGQWRGYRPCVRAAEGFSD